MSSPTDSVFSSELPINATGLDLVDRFQLPVAPLYPDDHLIHSVSLTAADYSSSVTRRLGAPPRTPNGSYLNSYAVDYPLLIRSWLSTATDDIRGASGVTNGAATYAQVASGANSSQVASGANSYQVAPGANSYQVAPGANSYQVAPGANSYQVAPGANSYQVAPGANSYQVALGANSYQVASGENTSSQTPSTRSTRSVTARSGATTASQRPNARGTTQRGAATHPQIQTARDVLHRNAAPDFPARLRQSESRFRELGTSSGTGGFVCVAQVLSTTGEPSLVGIVVNAPSVGRDADTVAAEDLGFEPGDVIHADIPPCPETVSFVAVSLRDSTRGPNASTRDSVAWASHEGHAGFLKGEQLCRSVLIFGHRAHDAPLSSDSDHIRALWSSDASLATVRRYMSEVPGEPCTAVNLSESPHLGFWTAPRALILPHNHNLPPGFVFDITQATLGNFVARISQWSGQPESVFAWFRNGLSDAWFKAAAHSPKEFAVHMFPLQSLAPTLDRWRLETIDTCVTARHRHFLAAVDRFRLLYFRDHLYSYATATMVAKYKLFDERCLATIQATPGLKCLAREPAMVPHLYYWCRPILPAWRKNQGFDLFTESSYDPPNGEKIFTPISIDHRLEAAAIALTRHEVTSAGRTPERPPPETTDASRNDVMLAIAAAQIASPQAKRKRDQAALPDGSFDHVRDSQHNGSFDRVGDSQTNPFALDWETIPDTTPYKRLDFPAPPANIDSAPGQGTQSSPAARYDPARTLTKAPVAHVKRHWNSDYHDRLSSGETSRIPNDNPFLAQLLDPSPVPPPPAPLSTTSDSKRAAVPQGFFIINCVEETLPLAQQLFGHLTAWNVEAQEFYATTPDPSSNHASHPFHEDYTLTPGKLSPKWMLHVGKPATREVAMNFLSRRVRQDTNAAGTNLPFQPIAMNIDFFLTDAFDQFRSGIVLETEAITSQASLTQGFTFHHFLMTLQGFAQPLIPSGGLSANQLKRLIENVGWILHISVHDSRLLSTEGDARSSFTEHSPLAWILRQVLTHVRSVFVVCAPGQIRLSCNAKQPT
jgi:hypothetical protein